MASEGSSYGTDEGFCKSLLEFEQYPDNVPWGPERPKLVSIFKHHFQEAKNKITLIQVGRQSRAKATLRKIRLFIFDRGQENYNSSGREDVAHQTPESSGILSMSSTQGDLSRFIFRPADLEAFLGMPKGVWPSTDYCDGDIDKSDFCFATDPVSRFIFLETSPATTGGRRLNITTNMLLQILTYHHVSPSFLNFISYYGWQPLTSDSDLLFGNLRCLKSFSGSEFRVPALDRSGLHYQLVFELKTVFDPLHWDDDNGGEPEEQQQLDMDLIPETKPKGFFSWLPRRTDDEAYYEAQTEEGYDKHEAWPIMRTAIYHRFDVFNGKSLWIITTGDKKPRCSTEDTDLRPEYLDVKDILEAGKAATDSPIEERFKSSLDVVVWLMEWSLSEYGFYIARLDHSLEELTQVLAQQSSDFETIKEKALKVINRLMESLDQCIVGLKANRRVAKALENFYRRELFQDGELRDHKLKWITETQGAPHRAVEKAAASLTGICNATNDMLRRAMMVKQVGTRREDIIHRLIQLRNEQTMRDLADLTYRDSTTMRIFSTITLILLPMSVVSTLFTTDIVRFQNISGFTGSWSGPAAIWWTGATLLTTLVVFFAGEAWRKSAIDEAKGRKSTAPRPKFMSPAPSNGSKWFSARFLPGFGLDFLTRRRHPDQDTVRREHWPSPPSYHEEGMTGGERERGWLPRKMATVLLLWRTRSASSATATTTAEEPHVEYSSVGVELRGTLFGDEDGAARSGLHVQGVSFAQGGEMERGEARAGDEEEPI